MALLIFCSSVRLFIETIWLTISVSSMGSSGFWLVNWASSKAHELIAGIGCRCTELDVDEVFVLVTLVYMFYLRLLSFFPRLYPVIQTG